MVIVRGFWVDKNQVKAVIMDSEMWVPLSSTTLNKLLSSSPSVFARGLFRFSRDLLSNLQIVKKKTNRNDKRQIAKDRCSVAITITIYFMISL